MNSTAFATAVNTDWRSRLWGQARIISAGSRDRSGENCRSFTDLEMCAVAIAYNTGGFNPAKGLRQGHFDGSRFYGEQILDFTRLSRSVALRPAACRRRAHSGADAGNGHRTVLRGRNADQLIACAQRAQDQFATHSLTAPIGIERVSNTQCDDRLGRERLLAQDRPVRRRSPGTRWPP